MTTTPNQPDRERRKVEDRAREMLAQLIGNDYSDTTLRVATDWLKQERRIAFRDADRAGEGEADALADPNAVHLNMLRGSIAKPSIAQIIHLYGADALAAALPATPLLDDETVKRCAEVAEDEAEGARVLHNAAAKDHDRDGCNIHGEAWRVGKHIATAIRALKVERN